MYFDPLINVDYSSYVDIINSVHIQKLLTDSVLRRMVQTEQPIKASGRGELASPPWYPVSKQERLLQGSEPSHSHTSHTHVTHLYHYYC